jgi:hypothetical protein
VHAHCYRADEILMLLRLAEDFGFKIATLQHVLEGYKVADEIRAAGTGASTFADNWAYKLEAYDAIPNPGYIALDPTERFLYSAHGDSSEVGAYARDPQTGRLKLLNKQQTGGDNSSTVMVDPGGRYVLLSTGPGVALFPVNADGSLAPASENIVPPGGEGPWREHQHGPHPHQAIFDLTGRYVVVPDKGLMPPPAIHIVKPYGL